jgi:dihydrolipoamide dehydrogenase
MDTRLLVIGGGPGGYIAAIRAAQLGIPTVLVEGEYLGGACLNIGCIPSKAVIHLAGEFDRARRHAAGSALGIRSAEPALDLAQAMRWKDGVVRRLTGGVAALLRRHGAEVINGWAEIVDGKSVDVRAQRPGGMQTRRISCEHLLLAPGSAPATLPSLPFGGRVISSTEALSPDSIPSKLVVVGAGYIGLELGIAYRKRPATRCACATRRAPSRSWPPTGCWWRSAAGRAPTAGAWSGCSWTWTAVSSRSTRSAAPRCATCGRSAT